METQIMRELRNFNVCLALRAKNFGHKSPYVGDLRETR
ncbi:hypothetical protein HNQ09_000107 [Deinococcus budaensis]|uniref:Uncharacterized protein n=1 Tax=Deinococcus budaensis TaxID=1665626 RepID=A0A7W8GBT1_9DEIO|nr:hypothetical protein [Deinococcus budaensis]